MSVLTDLGFRTVIGRAARSVLVDRPRSRVHPARGRFSASDIDELLDVVWRFEQSMPGRPDPQDHLRIRTTLRLAGFSLALLDALLVRAVEREYAIELVADVMARLALWWGRIGRGTASCPAAVETRPIGNGGFEVSACPVATFLRAKDAGDLCRAAWCDNAYAISEAAGVTLRRGATLAAGAPACHLWWEQRV